MKLMLSATALAVALSFASAAYAGPVVTNGGGGGGGPIGGDPGDEPDYYNDPTAGISGADSTGVGFDAVPTTPIGSTGFATPGYGTATAIGGAVQGGSQAQAGSLTAAGQVFTAPGGTLNQISFVDTNSATGGEELRIAVFNNVGFTPDNIFTNAGAVGPTLYSTQVSLLTGYGDKGGVNGNDALFYHTFSNINLSLTAGQSYYAYLVPTAGSQVFNGSNSGYASRAYFFELATQTSSLGGEFLAGTAGGSFFRVANAAANTAPFLQALYNISITPSATGAVPEPASWAMMIGGFGLVGAAMRRRRTAVAFA